MPPDRRRDALPDIPGLRDSILPLCDGYYLEPSVKFRADARESARMVLGIHRDEARPGLRQALIGAARALGVPDTGQDEIDLLFAEAHMLLLGQEGAGASAVRKIYLEFPQAPAHLPELRYIAWKVAPGRPVVRSLYRRVPVAAVLRNRQWPMAETTAPALAAPLFEILRIAAKSCPPEELTLMTVEEAGTLRASLNFSFYESRLHLPDIADPLARAVSAMGQDPALPEFSATAAVGHLSWGLDRDGNPFLTIYADARRRERRAPGDPELS
ncbi:hypothetical protein AB0T83_04990 [Fluviibacterium sp. DFM31]|uniref:Uncharacterized protein n=1 Tax=Meridianimarinicoccus marinus TaxID=3231483 RepID=A0ABV3L519_9RHOB